MIKLFVWIDGRTAEVAISSETAEKLRAVSFEKRISMSELAREAFRNKREISEKAIIEYLRELK